MLTLLWVVLLLLAALILVLLITPLHLSFAARMADERHIRVEARTFWGKSPAIAVSRKLGASTKPETPETKEERPVKREKRPRDRAHTRQLLAALPEFILSELRQIRIERLRLEAVFGTGDPAETGQLFGSLQAVRHLLPTERVEIAVTPDFDTVCLNGEAEVALSVRPVSLVPPGLRLIRNVWWARA